MDTELLKAFLELGVTGVLFVMWWLERKDRIAADNERKEKDEIAREAHEDRATLIECVTKNSAVMERLGNNIREMTVELRESRTRRLTEERREAS